MFWVLVVDQLPEVMSVDLENENGGREGKRRNGAIPETLSHASLVPRTSSRE